MKKKWERKSMEETKKKEWSKEKKSKEQEKEKQTNKQKNPHVVTESRMCAAFRPLPLQELAGFSTVLQPWTHFGAVLFSFLY